MASGIFHFLSTQDSTLSFKYVHLFTEIEGNFQRHWKRHFDLLSGRLQEKIDNQELY